MNSSEKYVYISIEILLLHIVDDMNQLFGLTSYHSAVTRGIYMSTHPADS